MGAARTLTEIRRMHSFMPLISAQRRDGKPLLYSGRVVGQRDYGDPIYGPSVSSDRGELGLASWYRMFETVAGIHRGDAWRVCIDVGLKTAHRDDGSYAGQAYGQYLDAIVNDFGDLVVIPRSRS